jgi:hypothetical protein
MAWALHAGTTKSLRTLLNAIARPERAVVSRRLLSGLWRDMLRLQMQVQCRQLAFKSVSHGCPSFWGPSLTAGASGIYRASSAFFKVIIVVRGFGILLAIRETARQQTPRQQTLLK